MAKAAKTVKKKKTNWDLAAVFLGFAIGLVLWIVSMLSYTLYKITW